MGVLSDVLTAAGVFFLSYAVWRSARLRRRRARSVPSRCEPRLSDVVEGVLCSHGLWYERSPAVQAPNGTAVTFRIEALDVPPLPATLVVYEDEQLHLRVEDLAEVFVDVGHIAPDAPADAIRTIRDFSEALVEAPLRTVTSWWGRVVVFNGGGWSGAINVPAPWMRPRGRVVEHGPWRMAEREPLTPRDA